MGLPMSRCAAATSHSITSSCFIDTPHCITNDAAMETVASRQKAHQRDAVDVRASAKSIQDGSQDAITRLDAMIAQKGEYTDIAKEMRDVYTDFKNLAADLSAASEFVAAALKSR